MKPFEQSSYLAQVRRLHELATIVLRQYPIRVRALRFIDHGENTTFQVTADDHTRMLLRIHRRGYHTEAAIREELTFLETLARRTSLQLQRPIRSKKGKLVVTEYSQAVGAERYCSVLSWIEGRLLRRTVSLERMAEVGKLLGTIHTGLKQTQITHRRYWDAEGLLGSKAKLGSIDRVRGLSKRDQKVLLDGREIVLRRLIDFQETFPLKQGAIHADLHFGNLIISTHGVAAIDFDVRVR